jgi:hypothetical protein
LGVMVVMAVFVVVAVGYHSGRFGRRVVVVVMVGGAGVFVVSTEKS